MVIKVINIVNSPKMRWVTLDLCSSDGSAVHLGNKFVSFVLFINLLESLLNNHEYILTRMREHE